MASAKKVGPPASRMATILPPPISLPEEDRKLIAIGRLAIALMKAGCSREGLRIYVNVWDDLKKAVEEYEKEGGK